MFFIIYPTTYINERHHFQAELLDVRLSTLTTEGVCQLLSKMDESQGSQVAKYAKVFQSNNINGKVLIYCDMEELKPVSH